MLGRETRADAGESLGLIWVPPHAGHPSHTLNVYSRAGAKEQLSPSRFLGTR